ncbi:hypothetical protein F4859DRAFT_509815 [Xylaria cf. heliscus]|nr:hypothetical protein F4859DRAFT_509815 [Xylaria cf. heliscus]
MRRAYPAFPLHSLHSVLLRPGLAPASIPSSPPHCATEYSLLVASPTSSTSTTRCPAAHTSFPYTPYTQPSAPTPTLTLAFAFAPAPAPAPATSGILRLNPPSEFLSSLAGTLLALLNFFLPFTVRGAVVAHLEFSPTPDRRQQRSSPELPALLSSPAIARSTPASLHRLRRTPNFSATPSPTPQEQSKLQSPGRVTVTVGPTGRYIIADQVAGRKPTSGRPRATRQLSQGNLSSSSVATSASFRRRVGPPDLVAERPQTRPVLRISKNTHNAVLYALEATLRGPNTISLDPVECYSQMADLMTGRGPATSNGNGAPSVRATPGRSAVGSPGIRGPKAIMKERQEREARQREERERLQREKLEEEQHLQEEAERREAERRAAEKAADMRRAHAAGAGPSSASVDPSSSRQPTQPTSNRPTADNVSHTARTSGMPTGVQAQAYQPARKEQPTSRPPHGASGPSATGATAGGESGTQAQPGEFSTAIGRGRNSFPHAFERWETLSAHWEGLTSFWIRRLEQNASEIQGDPVAQQLSRQVTDLSSAGANLFHAVVELQRLRASSERKFQRWFFETRRELERNQEVTAMLEAALEEERRTRADTIRKAVEQEQGSSKLHKQLAEMRKELTISKEEARRAWEELGRREQEERDRTTSLQLGQPTIVGGVQVVPMTQGVSRGNTQREPRYAQPEMPEYTQSPTPHTARPEYTQAPAVQSVPVSSGSIPPFQTPSSVHHQQSYASERTMSEEEFETPTAQPSTYHAPVSVPEQPQYSSAPDYTGSGYSATGWEELPGRHHHHHPTRLSDVLEEEEERSRTSASQLSRH